MTPSGNGRSCDSQTITSSGTRKILGIDPGASGGLARVDFDFGLGKITGVLAQKMPETEADIWAMVNALASTAHLAVIEAVHAMPGQGVTSMFSFGRNYGFLRGCLIASKLPVLEVSPARWLKGIGIQSKADKNAHKALAQQYFRDLTITHATADALLIGLWGAMQAEVFGRDV